ncbi:MAG: SUF system NifU family Fe-S cluster assembly protein [Pseudomonadota bacterium]|nr:SUF system NifU family Fe-S cluster assembly protein [Pseudomonadota bacterium]
MTDNDLRELYQEVILDHGKNPRNLRKLESPTCMADGNNPLCGDRLTVYLKINGQQLIEDAAFEGRGCAISIASASMMTEIIQGKRLSQVRQLFDQFQKLCTGVEDNSGQPSDDDFEKLQVLSGVRQFPMRVKCATLGWHAMDAALAGDNKSSTE